MEGDNRMKEMMIGLILLLLLIAITGCSGGEREGELPTWSIGDRWVYKLIGEGIEYTNISEVVGEDVTDGKDSYVMETSFKPPLVGFIDSVSQKFDKETMFTLRSQTSGEWAGYPWVSATNISYSSEDTLFPLEVGK